ncbi:MAG: Fic family protein [Planctomycetes bacterium]|nr:Fic family protein [Planctomycetota bacterium]
MTRHQETCDAVDQFGVPREVPLLRGAWKRWPNNPGSPGRADVLHEYCPPVHVESEMDQLVAWHAAHADVAPVVEAAWLHHRFTEIHPFQDGNGRIAGALATLVFLRAHGFPMVVTRDDRAPYIDALRVADRGDLRPLIDLFVTIQRRALLRALSDGADVMSGDATLESIVGAAVERLVSRDVDRRDRMALVTVRLAGVAQTVLESVRGVLERATAAQSIAVRVAVYRSAADSTHYFTRQIVDVARKLDYFANLAAPRSWIRLRIQTQFPTNFVVSWHHAGPDGAGLVVATAFLFHWVRDLEPGASEEDLDREPVRTERCCDQPFVVAVDRDPTQQDAEFKAWLERVIVIGLDAWRRRL